MYFNGICGILNTIMTDNNPEYTVLRLPTAVFNTLSRLAGEDKINLDTLLSSLLSNEDLFRHLEWDTQIKAFVRRACNRPECVEPKRIIPHHYGD